MPNRGRAPESPTSPKRLKVRERALQALEMRKAGATFEQIRSSLAYHDRGTAYRAVMTLLTKQTDEAAEPLRRLEVERCDKLQLAAWPAATRGDLKAIETVLRIMERRARLLGLDLARDTVNVGILAPPPEIRFVVEGQVRELPEPIQAVEVIAGHTGISGSE